MSGWDTIKAIKLLEERVDALGLAITNPGDFLGNSYNNSHYGDRVALRPKDDSMPHYSRDAIVWLGSLEELNHWLNGVDWARQYDTMLKISDHKKRSKAEADERNRQLMATIKKSKLVQGTHPGMFQNDIAVEDDQEVPF
jgi:hypothetical protein